MSDNVLVGGTLMGAAGAGAGYLASTKKTAEIAQKTAQMTEEIKLLKQPIVDQFAQLGYKEGMDITKAIQEKVNQNYMNMWSHGSSYEVANSSKALGKIWNKEAFKLKNLEKLFNQKMEKLEAPLKELKNQAKNIQKSHMIKGAGIGLGVYVLYRLGKAVFGGKKEQ